MTRLSHLNLRVADPVACRDFYCHHFGFQPEFEAEGGWFLRGDGGFLLAVVPTSDRRALPEGFHIGFSTQHADDVEATRRRLAGSGVSVSDLEDHRPDDDYVTFRCWDPDGTEVEVYWDGA